MAVAKWREVEYTDDGCSVYQCLSCYQQWEGRSSPEYGWKFCPFCGIQWTGGVMSRSHYTPRWRWELLEKPHQIAIENKTYDDEFYARQREIEDYIREVEQRSEAKQSVWVIEYRELKEDARWSVDDAFMLNPYRDREDTTPIHRLAYNWLCKARDDYEAERVEDIKNFWGDEDELHEDIEQDNLRAMCERMYPEREWRIRIVKKPEIQKLQPYRSVRYLR